MYNQIPYSFYNPGNYATLGLNPATTSGIAGLAKKGLNWNSFLNNAERTMNVINQAIPIYNQVKPMFRNMGTVFKVIGELNSAPAATSAVSSAASAAKTIATTGPQFFA